MKIMKEKQNKKTKTKKTGIAQLVMFVDPQEVQKTIRMNFGAQVIKISFFFLFNVKQNSGYR